MAEDQEAVVRATGLALALIGSVFERSALLPRSEFGAHLNLIARITGETDPQAGAILEQWAVMADQRDSPPSI